MGRGSNDYLRLDDVERVAIDETVDVLHRLMTEPHPVTDEDGTRKWWLNGELHREDGPAVEHPDGTRKWWLNGELHREDGPAVESSDGTREWWLNGRRVEATKSAALAR